MMAVRMVKMPIYEKLAVLYTGVFAVWAVLAVVVTA